MGFGPERTGICGISLILLLFLPGKAHSLPAPPQAGTSQRGLGFSLAQSDKESNTVSLLATRHSQFFTAQQTEDSTKRQIPNSLKPKSPYMAAFYSVIPGVLFHGAGHVYAEKTSTGIFLFGSELVGVGLMFLGGLSGLDGGESTEGGDNAVFAGTVLFVGSWLYDLIESPITVKKRNKKLLDKKRVEVGFRIKHGEPRLAAVWRF